MKYTNLAESSLASQLLIAGTTVDVLSGAGLLFPDVGAGNTFKVILYGSSYSTPFDDATYEVITAYQSSTDNFTLARGEEGTSAKQWEIGDKFMHTVTAELLSGFIDSNSNQTLTNKTLTSPVIGEIVNTGTLTLPTATGTVALTSNITGTNSGTNTGDNSANTNYESDYRIANFIADVDYQSVLAEGVFADGDKTKLDGIQAGATANVGDFLADGSVPMTGRLDLATGTTTVAPVKMTAGVNLTTPVAGVMEFDGTNLFLTIE